MTALDRVALVPPYTTGGGRRTSDPVWEAPRYVRTRGMTYWHRVRSAQRFHRDGRLSWKLWCGALIGDTDRALAVDVPPCGEVVHATCEGRALGSGQEDNPLAVAIGHTPRGVLPPAWCPGAGPLGAWLHTGGGRGRCVVCGFVGSLRWGRFPNDRLSFAAHRPGPGLVEPCPFHAWSQFGERDGTTYCRTCDDRGLL